MTAISPDDIRWNDEARGKILEDSDRVLREAVLDVASSHADGTWEDAFEELNARLKDRFIDFEPGPDLRKYAEAIVAGEIGGSDSGSESASGSGDDSSTGSDAATGSGAASGSDPADEVSTGGDPVAPSAAETSEAETASADGASYGDTPAADIAADAGASVAATPQTDGSADADGTSPTDAEAASADFTAADGDASDSSETAAAETPAADTGSSEDAARDVEADVDGSDSSVEAGNANSDVTVTDEPSA